MTTYTCMLSLYKCDNQFSCNAILFIVTNSLYRSDNPFYCHYKINDTLLMTNIVTIIFAQPYEKLVVAQKIIFVVHYDYFVTTISNILWQCMYFHSKIIYYSSQYFTISCHYYFIFNVTNSILLSPFELHEYHDKIYCHSRKNIVMRVHKNDHWHSIRLNSSIHTSDL